jgi:hypothetical protein
MVLWASGNRCEEKWGDDANSFVLDRPQRSTHLAFGHGIHACLGRKLAKIEVRVVLEELLRCSSWIKPRWRFDNKGAEKEEEEEKEEEDEGPGAAENVIPALRVTRSSLRGWSHCVISQVSHSPPDRDRAMN